MGTMRSGYHQPTHAGRLYGRPYVCPDCVRDDDDAPTCDVSGCALFGTSRHRHIVHTPDMPYDTPTSGAHVSVRTGASLAWTSHVHADGRACVLPDAPTTLIVRESGVPLLSERLNARDVPRLPTWHVASCAECRRRASARGIGNVRTMVVACPHVVADVRSVHAWTFDPWDGVRPSRALSDALARRDARADAERARLRADRRDDDAPAYVPHKCPRQRNERVPHALPHGGRDVLLTCRAHHATPADADACARHLRDVNAPTVVRWDRQRADVLARRASRQRVWDAVASASACRGNVLPPTFGFVR